VTGLIQMSLNKHYDGVLQITNDWTRAILLKHVAVLGMIAIGAAMQWGVAPALDRAAILVQRGREAPDLARLQRRERQLTALNLILGVIVLLFTAIATSI
jgi:putative copper export protein